MSNRGVYRYQLSNLLHRFNFLQVTVYWLYGMCATSVFKEINKTFVLGLLACQIKDKFKNTSYAES